MSFRRGQQEVARRRSGPFRRAAFDPSPKENTPLLLTPPSAAQASEKAHAFLGLPTMPRLCPGIRQTCSTPLFSGLPDPSRQAQEGMIWAAVEGHRSEVLNPSGLKLGR